MIGISSIISLAGAVFGRVSGGGVLKWVVIGLVALGIVGGLWWRGSHFKSAYALEVSGHEQTSQELSTMTVECARWKAAFDNAENTIKGLQAQVRDAETRAAKSRADALDRARILSEMKTRLRTEAEKLEVVDDETRRVVADRLNRPL